MTLRDHLTDIRPLRTSRHFRDLWIASCLTGFAGQIAAVAALAAIWDITGSPVWTGAIGLAQGLPMLLLGPLGGTFADGFDRRRVVLLATLVQAVAAIALTTQAAIGIDSPWPVLALVAMQSGATALGAPARRTLPVRLLPKDQVAAGLALQNIAFQASMLIGPAVGGVLVAMALPLGFAAQAAMLPFALLAAFRLPPIPPYRAPGMRMERGGWVYALRMPSLRGALLTDLAATMLSMPIAIFPLVNDLRFDGNPRTLGLFLSAIALGGITVGFASGAVTRVRRTGLVQLVCAVVWGLALVGFGLAGSIVVALSCLVVAGAADTTGVVMRGAFVQIVTPDRYRGRVSAVDHMIGVAGPELGNMRGGVLAGALGAPAALVIGGVSAAIAAIAIGVSHPTLVRYERPANAEGAD